MFSSQAVGIATYLAVDPEVASILTAVGGVTDAQAIVVANDKSLMSYVKGILTTVLGITGSDSEVAVYGPQLVDVDNIGHFEVTIVDKQVGLVPLADLTAGTYNLVRIRAGASTTISAAAAFSKANGRIYADITFATADWDTDDAFQIVPLADTEYDVGGVTFYPAIPIIQGYISDLSTISSDIAAIPTNPMLDTEDGSSFSAIPDMATATNQANQALEATLGVPASVAGTIAGDIADVQTVVDGLDTDMGALVNTGGTADLASIIGDVNNVPIATQLDNISSPHTWTGSISSTNYVDAGAEQTIVELVPGTSMFEINSIFLDLVNMTQDGTIKLYLKVDGTNYRELESNAFTVATDSDGVWIDFKALIMDDFKITYTEGADEGADRVVPYQIIYRSI